MRIASLPLIAICVTASALPAVAAKASSHSVCRPTLTATVAPQLRKSVKAAQIPRQVVGQCRSVAMHAGGPLPTCRSGPSITCRGSCSGGAQTITWQCCIDPAGFTPGCLLDCNREVARCLDQ
jgi:hypothetical protein